MPIYDTKLLNTAEEIKYCDICSLQFESPYIGLYGSISPSAQAYWMYLHRHCTVREEDPDADAMVQAIIKEFDDKVGV